MEKEYIGEVKDYMQVLKKAKELLKENKIDGISFISNKNYKINNQDIDMHDIVMIDNKDFLEKEFHYNTMEFLSSEKYELIIITKEFGCEFTFVILAIIYL